MQNAEITESIVQAVMLNYIMDERKHFLAVPSVTSLYDYVPISSGRLVQEG